METYYGTKVIKAKPMTQEEYAQHIGITTLSNMPDRSPPGYLVEYLNGGEPNHPDHDGCISWSPKAVFEDAYEPTTAMAFGHAVMALQAGHTVARAGWNGKNMFLFYVPSKAEYGSYNKHQAIRDRFGNDYVEHRAYIMMLTAQNDVVPWNATQSDILAHDWCIVD